MNGRVAILLIPALLAACATPPIDSPPPPEEPVPALEWGRTYTQWFYQGEHANLWDRLTPAMRDVFGNARGIGAFRQQVHEQAGVERRVEEEVVTRWLAADIYSRTARFSRMPGPVLVEWHVDASGAIHGFRVLPLPDPAPTEHAGYRTRAELRLPFDGEWFVFWGGRSYVQNYHVTAPDQRFAYDFVIARDGRTHAGAGDRNESYFCFGQPVLAPAAGVVRAAVDGVPDNVPGQMNEAAPAGNYVVLDHGNGEHSVLAHLRHRSVRVRVGESVARGQAVGECGNSGNSSEPHLHYHLQTAPEFGTGDGLPARFHGYRADGHHVREGEPTRGQFVADPSGR